MSDKYNEVHVLSDEHDEFIEIHPEYVYLTIPAGWICIYHKLLAYMADFGKTIVDDCGAICKGNSKNIITCWNLFQSAVACHALKRDKEAEFFIDYIIKQLDNIYKGTGESVYTNTVPIGITEDGKLKAIVSCDNGVHFYVDTETGKLYQEYLDDKNNGKVYTIVDGDLTVKDRGSDNNE